MANKGLSMRKVREVLRLHHVAGLSARAIARSLKVSPVYVRRTSGSERLGRQGAEALGLSDPVDPETCKAILEGRVPDGTGRHLGRKDQDGGIHHRPGRDVTFSAPKSVSLAALRRRRPARRARRTTGP